MLNSKGFDEELIEIDGKIRTRPQVAEHRKAQVCERHYAQLVVGKIRLAVVSNITLPVLLKWY